MISEQLINEFSIKLKERLSRLREDVYQELFKSDKQPYIELAGKVHDLEEESVADLLVDLNLADIDRHINEIRDIEAALLRIADRSYGTCCDCNRPIDTSRLRIYPTAKRCHPCQEQYEKFHMQSGQSSL